jgi:hypothetical protein
MAIRILTGALLAMALAAASAVATEPLRQPEGEVVLTVTGAIARTNGDGTADFDMAMLEAIGTARLATSTSWTDGVSEFEGVPMAALLDAVGAAGTVAVATALDGYTVELPIDELRAHPVLLATRMNGERLSVRERGPLWVVYPRDQVPEFQDIRHDAKWIWQLRRLEIR